MLAIGIPILAQLTGGVMPTESDQLQWFAAFWQLYPRKVAKADAWKRFRKLVNTPGTFDEVMAGLRAQLPAMANEPMKYRPHPSTWLHQERWKDEHIGNGVFGTRVRVIACEHCGDTGVLMLPGFHDHSMLNPLTSYQPFEFLRCSCPRGQLPGLATGPIDARDAL